MATVNLDELLRLWATEHLTPEMAIGHILQHLAIQHATISSLQVTLGALRMELQQSTSAVTPKPPSRKAPLKG